MSLQRGEDNVAAKDATMVSNILNATLPTATGGKPTTWTAMSTAGAMYIRLNSTASTASASGTQIANGSGYTTNGTLLGASSASSAGSSVTLPAANTSWACSAGGGWSIVSLDITDNAQTRSWFGNWNGQPIAIANGNTFQASANAVTAADS
jgi:hypothetical protein